MHINCISCGHKFDVGHAYDDYEGPVRCPTCRALLDVRTQDGNVRAVRMAARIEPAPRAETPEPARPAAA